jgi:threonine/homoserine/homoserine lactone efflux protein
MLMALLAGLVCGFVGSIPIAGPTAVLVIERALKGKSAEAFEIAVGAAVAELAYALLAYLGMTAFLSRFPWLLPGSRALGAAILLGLGLYLALRRSTPPRVEPAESSTRLPEKRTPGAMVLLGLVVTGVNPTLLASWSAVVTALHSTGTLRVAPLDGFPFALGVGVGSAGWFAVVVALLRRFRESLSARALDRVVRGIGVLLAIAGVAVTVALVRDWLR